VWLPEAQALEGTGIPLRGAAGPVGFRSLSQFPVPRPPAWFSPPVPRFDSLAFQDGPGCLVMKGNAWLVGLPAPSLPSACGALALLTLPLWPLRSAPPTAIEPRYQNSGTPTQLSDAKGKTDQGDRCESWDGPARSETLHTREVSFTEAGRSLPCPARRRRAAQERPRAARLGSQKRRSRMRSYLPGKPEQRDQPAEMVEGRSAAKGTLHRTPHPGHRAGIIVC
jgi:hypothetical protein